MCKAAHRVYGSELFATLITPGPKLRREMLYRFSTFEVLLDYLRDILRFESEVP